MAACSPWFDSKLKMYKATREQITIDECKDYEIFHAILTFCYTGNIVIDKNNIGELMHLANFFSMSKLRSYCCEWCGGNMNIKSVHTVVDVSMRYNITDLLKHSLSFVQKNFKHLYHHDRGQLLNYPINQLVVLLDEHAWQLPQEYLLRLLTQWVAYNQPEREDHYMQLLEYISWQTINQTFVFSYLDQEPFFCENNDALYGVLYVLEKNNIFLGPKYQQIYNNLQENVLPADQSLDELNDSNSLLSQAINSAVKDLEHAVDADWFFTSEPQPTPNSYQQPIPGAGNSGYIPPPPSGPHQPLRLLPQTDHHHHHHHQLIQHQQHLSYAAGSSSSSQQPQLMGSHSQQQPQPDPSSSQPGSSSKETKFKDTFDFEIVEQLISEDRSALEPPPTAAAAATAALDMDDSLVGGNRLDEVSSAKRFDPKFRAINEAFRLKNETTTSEKRHHNYSSQQQNLRNDGTFVPQQQSRKPYPDPHQQQPCLNPPVPEPAATATGAATQAVAGAAVEVVARAAAAEVVTGAAVAEAVAIQAVEEEEPETYANDDFPDYVEQAEDESFMEEPAMAPQPAIAQPAISQPAMAQPAMAQPSMIEPCQQPPPAIETSQPPVEDPAKAFPSEEVVKKEQFLEDIKKEPQQQHQTSSKQHVRKAKLLAQHRSHDEGTAAAPPAAVVAAVVPDKVPVQPAADPPPLRPDCSVDCSPPDCPEKETTDKVKVPEETNKGKKTKKNPPSKRVGKKCPHCSYETPLSSRMRVHLNQHTKGGSDAKREPEQCPFCEEFQTSWKREMREHVVQRHVFGPPFKCVAPGCTYASPKFYMFFNHWHLHSPITTAKYTCDQCEFAAATVHRLRSHKKTAHEEKRFECSVCQAKFVTRTLLKKHGLVHTGEGEGELKCSHPGCNFKTKYSNYLKTHMKLHTDQDIFKCDRCEYKTPKASLMQAHDRMHKGEKNFKCETCSRAFVEKSQLTRHARIHSEQFDFACTVCKFKTKRKDKLKNHMVKIHSSSDKLNAAAETKSS